MTDASIPPATKRPPLSVTTAGFGMIVFLASDLMLFAAFFAAYFLLRSINQDWPSSAISLDVVRASLATAALIASSGTMIAADRALGRGNLVSYRRWLVPTIGLGILFLGNQLLEYRSLDILPSTDAYGSIYWMLTGLHALHVTAGVIALALLFTRARRATSAHRLESWNGPISAFWHLVDVVWIAVFITIWLIQ